MAEILVTVSKLINRAKLFSLFSEQSVICVNIDSNFVWFMAQNFQSYNPSNHIYENSLMKCKDITHLVYSPEEFDQDKFLTKLDEVPAMNFSFPNEVTWFRIR